MTGASAERLRVVVFTGGAVLEDDVVEFLGRIHVEPSLELVGVFCQTSCPGMRGIVRDLFRRRRWLAPVLLLQRALRRVGASLLRPAAEIDRRRTLRTLGGRIYMVPDLHAAKTLDHIASLSPDIGAVYGGPILRPALFELPAQGTIGIHHGLLPHYRGKKTTFWALYNGEARVGVAIQRIGTGLDEGDILRQATLEVGRSPLPVLRRRLQRHGLEAYREGLLAVQRGEASFLPQPERVSPKYRDPTATDIVRFWMRDLPRIFGLSVVRKSRRRDR